MQPEPTTALSLQEQNNIIPRIFDDFCTDADTMFRYLKHVGFDFEAISHVQELLPAYLGHYRLRNGTYDVERACNDLATWPPIAAMIEKGLRQKARAARKVRSLAK
jgi:hypothetical protein